MNPNGDPKDRAVYWLLLTDQILQQQKKGRVIRKFWHEFLDEMHAEAKKIRKDLNIA